MSKNHYTEYKNYSSLDLISKVNRWCSGLYLSSKKFAEMRETLRIRIKFLNNYNRNNKSFTKIINNKALELQPQKAEDIKNNT